MNKYTKRIIISILIIALYLLPITVNAEYYSIPKSSRAAVYHDYYFFIQGGTDIQGPTTGTWLNYAAFMGSGNNGFEEDYDPHEVCLALPKQGGGAGEYVTYYGDIIMINGQTPDFDNEKSDPRVEEECNKAGVWTVEEFYKMYYQAYRGALAGDTIKYNPGIIFNSNYLKMVDEDSSSESVKVSSVCTGKAEERNSSERYRYFKHFGNISGGNKTFETGFDQCTATNNCTIRKKTISQYTEDGETKWEIPCPDSETSPIDTEEEAAAYSAARNTKLSSSTTIRDNNPTLIANVIEETINIFKSKIKLLADTNQKAIKANHGTNEGMEDTTTTIPIINNGEVTTVTVYQLINPGNYDDKKYVKLDSDKKVSEYYEYVPKDYSGEYKFQGRKNCADAEIGHNIRKTTSKFYLWDFNTYNSNCTQITSGTPDTKLYPIKKTSSCFDSFNGGNAYDSCCAAKSEYINQNTNQHQCLPIYEKIEITDNKWKNLIKNYNDDDFKDTIGLDRCYINGSDKALYHVTECSTTKCHFSTRNNVYNSDTTATISRGNLHGVSQCNGIETEDPSTPSTPGSSGPVAEIVLTKNTIKNADNSANKNVFGIVRQLDQLGYLINFGTTDVTLKAKRMPALVSNKIIPHCDDTPKDLSLTCESPQQEISYGLGSNECSYLFEKGTDSMIADFNQKGILKVNLLGTYIKSGTGFTFDITYEDTLKMTVKSGNKNEVEDELRSFVTGAELFNTFESSVTFAGKTLDGTWKYYINGTAARNAQDAATLAADSLIANDEFVLQLKYELDEVWTSPGKITSKGALHETSPSVAEGASYESAGYRNDGKIKYTELDLDTDEYVVKADLFGLSALKYKSTVSPFWKASYECGINCVQEFFDKDELINSQTKGYKFSYREIDNKDPFPIKKESASSSLKDSRIGIDGYWLTWADSIGHQENITTERALTEYIEPRLNNAYSSNNLQYSVYISPQGVKYIKEYNNNNDNNYYSGVRYDDGNKSSKFLNDHELTSNTGVSLINGFGVYRNLNKLILNPVGYCGTTRTELAPVTGEEVPNIKDTECFCIQTDTADRCIYNKKIEGVGY